jgi:hypothetical protein
MQSLAERNVPVCPIDCEADLTYALSTFASSVISQDIRSWLKIPS